MTKGISLGLLVLLVGCAAESRRSAEPVARLDLLTAQNVVDVTPVGLAISSDGQRYIFEDWNGLLRIDGDQVTSVMSSEQMPTPDKPIRLPITDIVSLAPNLFAMTALGDGFLLDTTARTLTQHFCYFPDGGDGFPTSNSQRTDAIAYDAVADKIYAQPLTYDAASALQFAQVARYNRVTGVDEEWYDAPQGTSATGAVFVQDVGLVLGQGAKLSRYDVDTRTTIELDDLTRFGVLSIDGMAIDPAAKTLVVVDQVTDAVFDIDLASLSL